jgi:Protein of unknown function (DUF3306)
MPTLPDLPIDTEDSGFLSRWSRRKTLVRDGAEVAPVAPAALAALAVPAAAIDVAPVGATASLPVPIVDQATAPATRAEPEVAERAPPAAEAEPALTLDDVAALTRDSNFARFVKQGVNPEVKNAALSKLFTDPHFNVMDGLDTYIDDYGKPDPLPEGMLRKMLQAHVLGLFDHEKEDPQKDPNTDVATDLAPDVPPACEAAPPTEPTANENTDLQLQPDDGAGRPGAETGVEQDAGCAH